MSVERRAAVEEDGLAVRYMRVRERSVALCGGLSAEDMMVQSMPDASPTKWHLAHTSWFFEQFVLAREAAYVPPWPQWHYLFNSYYEAVGPRHARPHRGLLSRPALSEVLAYREHVDAHVAALLASHPDAERDTLIELGLQHEQQHQELLVTDIKHALWSNPLRPAWLAPAGWGRTGAPAAAVPLRFITGVEGIAEIGHRGDGFAFDNETPRHRCLLQPHALANRPVSNAEFASFIREGGYREPSLWLSDGWAMAQREAWAHPLYWADDLASEFTLAGVRPIEPHAPVSHISYFEADAFARWAGARLPTEAEWEVAASGLPVQGHLQEPGVLHPRPAVPADGLLQMYGDVWEWTGSAYLSYPGFQPLPGALGEYNGKFMNGQWVLRGGSCATAPGHLRPSYRNFFPPHARWQFSGLRLGQDR